MFIKQQSKFIFNGIGKSIKKYGSHAFKQIKFTMDKSIYVRFSELHLGNLLMFETFYDIFQPYFGQDNWIICICTTWTVIILY